MEGGEGASRSEGHEGRTQGRDTCRGGGGVQGRGEGNGHKAWGWQGSMQGSKGATSSWGQGPWHVCTVLPPCACKRHSA